ncbi:MAG: hypothetical protein JST00_00045 [Deltaproteobacteria bacterium]|nr:hypothetical protein [Deltaproteobacteria bacterium]
MERQGGNGGEKKGRAATWASEIASHATLLVGGTAATLAVLLHSWDIGLAGAAACGVMVVVERAGKWRPRRLLPRSPLGSAAEFTDPQTASAVQALTLARAELERTLAQTEASLVADLSPALAQVGDLEARGAKLAQRSEEIARYLAKSDHATLRRECDALAARATSTADAAARAHYAAAHSARREHLKTLDELMWTKERIGATLLSIAATLDAIAPKIVRLRGLDGGASDLTRDVGRDLASMTEQLTAFEEVLVQVNEGA